MSFALLTLRGGVELRVAPAAVMSIEPAYDRYEVKDGDVPDYVVSLRKCHIRLIDGMVWEVMGGQGEVAHALASTAISQAVSIGQASSRAAMATIEEIGK